MTTDFRSLNMRVVFLNRHADKVKRPLLLIHGEDDNNTGTFPMQSERFYSALKGSGATCRQENLIYIFVDCPSCSFAAIQPAS